MLNLNDILESLQSCPQGYLKPDHVLFSASNANLKNYRKLGAISNKDVTFNETDAMFCNELGCSAVFNNISSYQTHYNVMHRYICAECKKSLPTNHLLDLHISELHDSYFKARIERGERLFKCYLEECKETFGSSSDRKEHCIKQHKLPSNFRFDQTGHKKCLDKKHLSGNKLGSAENEAERELTKIKHRSQLKTISFGHQKEKTFYPRSGQGQKEAGKTLEDMNMLKHALESL